VSTKDVVEWAYYSDEKDEWIVVDHKSVLASNDAVPIPENIVRGRGIGFEGRPDPATGFYCMYNDGRIVASGGGG
jgi:hypothetical protein